MTKNCSCALPVQEISSLVQFANTTSIGFWDTSNTAGACDWSGLTCRDDTVVELRLNWKGLRGEIPACIGDLHHLEYFSVADNDLSGPIPESFGILWKSHPPKVFQSRSKWVKWSDTRFDWVSYPPSEIHRQQ
ncbi:hypothetical protein TrLO_g12737 [Triparma laevis f. longispina]|uniref:Leucine-rich repeat-containing N-terminal plant-type domain-containing protein n=1 Tax=Triparma laevis f. longispina TaxID=1714387 RepID=A0A9W6ZGS6_9STRA|nr:hypothetical protein TrLO_g12737 [Triparma laevis f. longispina]